MIRILIICFVFLCITTRLQAQNTFNWEDSTLIVGQTKSFKFAMVLDGPCTVIPCYDVNKELYDSILTFLNRNKNVSVAFIWHTGTLASSLYNYDYSKINAEGLIEELVRLGIRKDRISAIGLGESRYVVPQEEIQKIDNLNERAKTDWMKNNRIEMIITATSK